MEWLLNAYNVFVSREIGKDYTIQGAIISCLLKTFQEQQIDITPELVWKNPLVFFYLAQIIERSEWYGDSWDRFFSE